MAGDLGQVIVDSEGMTLYDFHKDKGTTSACYGACESAWPPLTTSGKAQAKGGAQSSMLSTTERKDGTMQVTYNGHPLYTFVEDKKTGEAKGNDFTAFGAQWYALMPNGEEPGRLGSAAQLLLQGHLHRLACRAAPEWREADGGLDLDLALLRERLLRLALGLDQRALTFPGEAA